MSEPGPVSGLRHYLRYTELGLSDTREHLCTPPTGTAAVRR